PRDARTRGGACPAGHQREPTRLGRERILGAFEAENEMAAAVGGAERASEGRTERQDDNRYPPAGPQRAAGCGEPCPDCLVVGIGLDLTWQRWGGRASDACLDLNVLATLSRAARERRCSAVRTRRRCRRPRRRSADARPCSSHRRSKRDTIPA